VPIIAVWPGRAAGLQQACCSVQHRLSGTGVDCSAIDLQLLCSSQGYPAVPGQAAGQEDDSHQLDSLLPCMQVDLAGAAKYGLKVVRVPAYSPRSVAEHALALTFALARSAAGEMHVQGSL
jgi:hypothetical protein